jgi:hypothetical protein
VIVESDIERSRIRGGAMGVMFGDRVLVAVHRCVAVVLDTLYIFTNTCLSALHSIYMNKFDKKSMELTAKIQAAQAAAVAAKSGSAVKGAKNANVPAAKVVKEPVRAITSGDDDTDDSDDEVAEPSAKSAPRVASARQRPKKKKGRR